MFANETTADFLLSKYDRPTPRYTSFPAATHFHENVEIGDFLASLDKKKSVSIYVHIPFCHSLCHYCGCHTKIVQDQGPITSYIAILIDEIRIFHERAGNGIAVQRVHFGGGSPNYANTDLIESILQEIKKSFEVLPSCQIDMECDPRRLTAEKIADYARIGISRFSLGIQDFDPEVQKAINRVQPYEMIEERMADFRKSGVKNINFDLIVGLPKQTPYTVGETVEKVVRLQPSRLAVFPYAHVPWMKKHQLLLEKYGLPDAKTRLNMISLVGEKLKRAGYVSVGMDHFAKPEDDLFHAQNGNGVRRNFQGYTDDPSSVVLGFGLSAISQFENGYLQNTTNAVAYKKSISQGALPSCRGYILNESDKKRKKLIDDLLCRFNAPIEEVQDLVILPQRLVDLQQDGIVTIECDTLKIADKGKVFARVVASCFDPYYLEKEERHARAV